MNNRIIALYGEIGHGKDEAGKQIAAYLKAQGHHVVNQRFALKLKQFASMVFNIPLQVVDASSYSEAVWDFTREQKAMQIPHYTEPDGTPMTLGRFLQVFATECVRDGFDKDFWANCTFDRIDHDYEPTDFHIITDLRFPNELKLLQEKCAHTVFIKRPDHSEMAAQSGRDTNHSSETSLVDKVAQFNHVILNDGTLEEFQLKCQELAQSILPKILQD